MKRKKVPLPFVDGAEARRLATHVRGTSWGEAQTANQKLVDPRASNEDSEAQGSGALLVREGRHALDAATRLSGGISHLISPQTYRRLIRDLQMRHKSAHVDELGHDPLVAQRWRSILSFLQRDYRGVSVSGLEHVPDAGRVLVVSNHASSLPFDALTLMRVLSLEHPAGRALRPLLDDDLCHAPFIGPWLARLGCARASQANGLHLLEQELAVLVFPEGAKGRAKRQSGRYPLARFGRGGFIRLALRARAPIVPVALTGAEQGFLPLPWPSRWRIRFGPPLHLDHLYSAHARGEVDPAAVAQLSERVKHQIQRMLDELRAPEQVRRDS